MEGYYFLFALAFLWTIFATIQDLKKKEVANWLNFSLVAFALSYRAFYAIFTSNLNFFLFGILGFAVFFAFAHFFYYTRTFAGGDAKLLMGYGIILPYPSYSSILTTAPLFIFLLFLVGSIYSLLYSVPIAVKNKKKFSKGFSAYTKKIMPVLITILVMLSISTYLIIFFKLSLLPYYFIFLLIILLLPVLYAYTKALDNCMLVKIPAKKLSPGDWLEKDVKVKNRVIEKSVHGLSTKEIEFLQRNNRSVLIKQGIPFTPAFLLSLLIMVSFFLISQLSPEQVWSFLFSAF